MGKPELKVTLQLLRVTQFFMNCRGYKASGADIMKATGIASGTVYPLLSRMEACGWVRAEWEEIDPSEAGRPRRRYYFLTGLGQKAASNAMAETGLLKGYAT